MRRGLHDLLVVKETRFSSKGQREHFRTPKQYLRVPLGKPLCSLSDSVPLYFGVFAVVIWGICRSESAYIQSICIIFTYIDVYFSYEYRTKLGMTKVVLRGSWGSHRCKTDRGPP